MTESKGNLAIVENTTWQGEAAVRFAAGGYEALMIPGVGANVIMLKDTVRGLDILRTPEGISTEDFKERPQVYGIPVLFPPNRIEDGTFTAANRKYNFTINEVARNNSLHGFLHRRSWKISRMEVVLEDTAQVEAVFEANSSSEFYTEFPHEFEFKLLYTLSKSGLDQKISITNKSNSLMPMGLGFHTAFKIPFHPKGNADDYRLYASIGDKWELNDRVLPTGKFVELDDMEKEYRDHGVKPVGHVIDLQHFTAKNIKFNGKDFNGAIIEDKHNELRLVYRCGSGFGHWMIWNMDGEHGFVCPEPQTWAVNAPNINLPDNVTGMKLLKPGEIWEDSCQLFIEKI